MTDPTALADRLYGGNPAYARALLDLCAHHGWTVHLGRRPHCLTRLDRPRHRCTTQACYSTNNHGSDVAGRNLDHVVWLRRGPAADPDQWAVLSQPYSDHDPSGTAIRLGPAPYGHGTTALLYEGRGRETPHRLPDVRSVTAANENHSH